MAEGRVGCEFGASAGPICSGGRSCRICFLRVLRMRPTGCHCGSVEELEPTDGAVVVVVVARAMGLSSSSWFLGLSEVSASASAPASTRSSAAGSFSFVAGSLPLPFPLGAAGFLGALGPPLGLLLLLLLLFFRRSRWDWGAGAPSSSFELLAFELLAFELLAALLLPLATDDMVVFV